MKVLMNLCKLNIGGTEEHVRTLAQSLRKHGVVVGIATNGGPLVASYRKRGIAVHVIGKKSPLISVIAKGKYQIVHAHDAESFRNITALHHIRRMPTLISVHGTYHRKSDLIGAARNARHVIAVSPKLQSWIRGMRLPANKISVIPNGIEMSTFRPTKLAHSFWKRSFRIANDAQILVHVGRFSSDKFPVAKKIIMAAEIVARQNKHFIAILVGPGSHRLQLSQLAEGVNRRVGRQAVFVRPPIPQISHIYHVANAVIGTGRVALEAMACGKAVIAVGVAGYHGIIVPTTLGQAINGHFGDHAASQPISVAKMAQDINKLMREPKWARSLGKFGNHVVSHLFSIQNVSVRLLNVYKKILK